ncbi:MAG: GNAT family N-acetyltransferase [Thiogranum sp.]
MANTMPWNLRPAGASDLGKVNRVIETAIDTWQLPARVKRLSKPVYRYSERDLDFLDLVVAEAEDGGIVGVAAWEQAELSDAPAGRSALLLHGIYVAPDQHRKGVGTQLFEVTEKAASSRGLDGVLVKAQPGAQEFFFALGLERVPVEDHRRDYSHRFWKPVNGASDAAHGESGRSNH